MKFEKELVATIVDPGLRHVKYRKFPESFWSTDSKTLSVAKEERFAFQIMVCYNHTECQYTVEKRDSISWKGLTDRVRLELKAPPELEGCFDMKFLGYVKDDEGTVVSDPILEDTELLAEKGISQCIWVEGKVPKGCNLRETEIAIDMYSREGYEDEQRVKSLCVKLKIADISMDEIAESSEFYLDLWQHPSNWARMYHVGLWSDDHFEVIGHNLRELASAGNKVVTAIVSDFPWAGQKCYEEYSNPSNLFEYNMVRVKKDMAGGYLCDFSALDRYVELAFSLGIDKEIDLFGLIGVWDRGFGNPLKDYEDALKISYYDECTGTFRYMSEKYELAEYIAQLLNHLEERNWLEKTRIMSDHPVDDMVFESCKEFIESVAGIKNLKFKSAIYREDVIRKHSSKLDDVSLSLPLSVKIGSELGELKREIHSKGGKMTWYVCWFPEAPNNFISSPLLENRLVGWYTYLLGFDGFLRWDYAIWPSDPWSSPSYKQPYWSAGDMYFVYPGANGRPVRSQRWENLKFGIQDFQLLKAIEKSGYSKSELEDVFITPLLGRLESMEVLGERSMEVEYRADYSAYKECRSDMFKMFLNRKK